MSVKKATTVQEPLFHLAKRSEIAVWKAWLIRLAVILLGFAVCGIVAFVLIEKLQDDPSKIVDFYRCFYRGTFSTSRKLWKFLKNLAILQCISLAVTPAFRMRFWNIGAEGQTLVSVLGCIAVAFYLGGTVPAGVLLVLMFVAAVLCGMIWALIPALFKARWNTNETLFTLMMNYVATFLVSYFLIVWVPSGSSTLGKLKHGALPSFGHDYLVIILVALLLTVGLYIYLKHSKHGYEISVVGESQNTARYIGINVKKVIVRTMIISGALCGIAGFLLVAGTDHTVTRDTIAGRGFTAIMVSWLAKFNPLYMVLTSLLIVFMERGAIQISTSCGLNNSFSEIITGIIIFFIIGCEFFLNYQIKFREKEGK